MNSADHQQPRRRHIVGPVILVTLGILFLLNNLGLLTWGFWGTIWRFWPVILILLGIELLFGGSHPWLGFILAIAAVVIAVALGIVLATGSIRPLAAAGPAATESISERMGNLQRASVDIDFGAGELVLASLPTDSNDLIDAKITHGQFGRSVKKQFSESNGEGNLSLRSEGGFSALFGSNIGDYWDVRLNPNLPLDVQLKIGASRNTVDLSDLDVRQLRVDVGAGTAEIKFPRQGSTRAYVKAGASNVDIEIPQGVAAQIEANVGLGSFDVDESRFPRRGKYYASSDFDSAASRIELTVDSGVASVTVR